MDEKKTPFFERFSNAVTHITGSSSAFIVAVILILVWAATGPLFHFSENWQLVVNTGTTIITFLMVFLIQKSQNKESKAIQLKLNELISSARNASNRLVSVENLDEKELDELQALYIKMSEMAKEKNKLNSIQTIETEIENIGNKVDNIDEKVDDIGDRMDDIDEKVDLLGKK